VGNTVTTGSVTIPMMKKTGYKGEFAGAVEAAASTGGQIMPPIMGAAAFLMADYVAVPYSHIIVRAILPAFLYFLGIFIGVHLEAKRLGLRGMSKEELPIFKRLVKHTYLLLPLIILVYLVSSGTRTMAFSAAIAIIFAVAVSNLRHNPPMGIISCAALLAYLFIPLPQAVSVALLLVGILAAVICMLRKDVTMTPAVFFDSLANGGKGALSVASACAIAGVIAGCITMTGLASQIITAIITVSHGVKFIALFLTMICCIILGMGVPTTANYCIMASTCAPILIELGIPNMAAHFFVFYFGIVADITPPVALAAYAGSAIAKSKPMQTALNATKLAIAAFIIPYIFALNPAMLLIDTNFLQVAMIIVTSIIGMVGVSSGLEGYLKGSLPWPLRIVAIAAGLLLLIPGTLTDVIGIVVIAALLAFQLLRQKKAAA
jgi:TRAP transporter 4TM/12TM fusion protein